MLYPLRFKEILRNYGFGNRWIAREFAKQGLPEDHRIAETWEVCDRPGESSEVINRSPRGRTLHELIEQYGQELLGEDIVAKSGLRFPLLIKFLDASNPLGDQVHQDDELAEKQGLDDPGKTEAWYMLRVIEPANGSALLKAYVPDLLRDVVQPLRSVGVEDDDIVALGGKTRLNPLLKHVIVSRRTR